MEKCEPLSVSLTTVSTVDGRTKITFHCSSGVRGGCALHKRERVLNFIDGIPEIENNGIRVSRTGFDCALARDKNTADAVAPAWCDSELDLKLPNESFDHAVEVTQHSNGNTTFRFR